MFLKSQCSYGRDGQQRAQGQFLMVFSRPKSRELRALVRYVKMHQCGNFMMSRATVKAPSAQAANDTVAAFDKARYPSLYRVADGHYRISLSGTYGGDGLPIDAESYPGLWEQLHPLPPELVEAFWQGGGHNSAGSEGPAIHQWATENRNKINRLRSKETHT